MGRLRRTDTANGTLFRVSSSSGVPGTILAVILLAVGGGLTTAAASILWPALTHLFGPGKGGVGGWMAWFFDQFMSVAMLPMGLIGVALVLVGMLLLSFALFYTSVRRDGDDLDWTLDLLGLRLYQYRIPLSTIARLGLRIADSSTVGKNRHDTFDLVAQLHPGAVMPTVVGVSLPGRLIAYFANRDRHPLTSTALLCKLTDNDEAQRLVEELAKSWNLPFDATPQERPPMSELREERQRLER